MANILVINGPNLNMLGKREPEHYGRQTLGDIIEELETLADDYEVRLYNFQSNAEHEIVERIQTAIDDIDFIIINPAAFTHTSVAIRDALSTVKIPFIEVHLSNIHKREAFRTHSYFSDLAEGVIAGLGPIGYQLALAAAVEKLK
ncbi:MAG: type II 3-dehydroquinate dehydratase [Hydrogenovibrio crunogenus]|uniref:3-dehydroquinate dehydratase n=1 Tax=Hydrogenovibrio crunogenus (strain DSM 25203 / XCL-2) TaxID=317025 RepID=AROQ_HYDCU|nr:RecName: Full=3-dehydroquinate dehydratase; Short=3-dehydroquinase; AltName: Full=Type II DHQase [Hydrogenovibrio crunogenus XCL-2]AIM47463.1 3-dehydroquinate dehydratase [uncultured bacterium]MBD3611658.1 type II 3-dehydroquinate dehydratase [Hydrogenovibrio crunogenus]